MERGYYYFCDCWGGWFVCFCANIREARKTCILEHGSGSIKEVRRATKEEIEKYCEQKNIDHLWSWGRFNKEYGKEANRRFQMRGIN